MSVWPHWRTKGNWAVPDCLKEWMKRRVRVFHRSSQKGGRKEEASRRYLRCLGRFPFWGTLSIWRDFYRLWVGNVTRSERYKIQCSSFLASGTPKLLVGCPPVVISAWPNSIGGIYYYVLNEWSEMSAWKQKCLGVCVPRTIQQGSWKKGPLHCQFGSKGNPRNELNGR